MQVNDIKQLIKQQFPQADIEVSGDGAHFEATVVDESFNNQSLLKRQQRVYRIVSPLIQNGTIHALQVNALTPTESTE